MIFVHWKQYLWPKKAHLGKILAAKKQIIRFFNLVLCGTADGAIVVITGIKPSSTLPVHLCRLWTGGAMSSAYTCGEIDPCPPLVSGGRAPARSVSPIVRLPL